MTDLLQYLRNGFYSEVALFLILLATLGVSIKHRDKIPGLRFFPVYLVSFLTLLAFEYILMIIPTFPTRAIKLIDFFGNYVVTIIEFFTFFYFFHFTIQSNAYKRFIRILCTITCMILSIPFLISASLQNIRTLHTIYIIESIVLVLICILYFIELFNSPPILSLTNTSHFWISSGLLFYLLGTLPVTIITDYVYTLNYFLYANLYAIVNVFYCLLFILVIRAYKCTSQTATYLVSY